MALHTAEAVAVGAEADELHGAGLAEREVAPPGGVGDLGREGPLGGRGAGVLAPHGAHGLPELRLLLPYRVPWPCGAAAEEEGHPFTPPEAGARF